MKKVLNSFHFNKTGINVKYFHIKQPSEFENDKTINNNNFNPTYEEGIRFIKSVLLSVLMISFISFTACVKEKRVPKANFSFTGAGGDAPCTVSFSNSSLFANSYIWDFGDSNTSTDVHPTHSYTTGGTFTVLLTATGDGGTDTISKTLIINNSTINPLAQAKNDYQNIYLATKAIPLQWTGTSTSCQPGDINATVRQNVVARINYFRHLVGLTNNITLNTSQNQRCQEAALYMLANTTITQNPQTSGQCYTTGAADAASHGILAISMGINELKANHSVNSVKGYIEEPSVYNSNVNERAWLLYPQLSAIGTGSVFDANKVFAANCIMWGNNLNGPTPSIDYVAYPPNGFIPSPLVFSHWSFHIHGADFLNASVTMTDTNGVNIPVNIVYKSNQQNSSSIARIVWEPQGQNFPQGITADTEYQVTVSGITGAKKSTYSYTVKVFWEDPSNAKGISSGKGFSKILSVE